ncbi:hypothetical protein C2E23DRAFT_907898 [Lenzites betulinus]|nr:hypothetical protein C2E23DRAFT_907898 [Lenzites betulinus]
MASWMGHSSKHASRRSFKRPVLSSLSNSVLTTLLRRHFKLASKRLCLFFSNPLSPLWSPARMSAPRSPMSASQPRPRGPRPTPAEVARRNSQCSENQVHQAWRALFGFAERATEKSVRFAAAVDIVPPPNVMTVATRLSDNMANNVRAPLPNPASTVVPVARGPPIPRLPAMIADNTDDFTRALAFASRDRVSGSGLPRVPAQLAHMLDTAPADDARAATLFTTLLARKLLLERRARRKIARLVNADWQCAHWGTRYYGDRNADPGMTEEQRAMRPWLERRAAYLRAGGGLRMLESARGQGVRPRGVREREVGMSLRERVLRYRGERAVYRECCHFGICYPKPRRVRVHPEVTSFGEASRVRDVARRGGVRELCAATDSPRDLSARLCRELLPGPRELRIRCVPERRPSVVEMPCPPVRTA